MVDRSARGNPAARLVVVHGEPAERPALQHERFDYRLSRNVFLHHAEQRGFVKFLLVIRLHRFGCQDARADQRDWKHQKRHHGKLPVQEQHQYNARDHFEERQRSTVGETFDRAFERGHVDRKSRQGFSPRLVRA